MPDPTYTAVGAIIDQSGSMGSHVEQVLSGYADFLREQREIDGRSTITRTLFSDAYPPDIEHDDLASAEPLTHKTYRPGGTTALIDACCHTINAMGERFDALPEAEKPAHVVVCIITDGKENASRRFDQADLRDRIREQEETWGWEFIFIGAGIDAFAEASNYGMSEQQTYSAPEGASMMKESMACLSEAVANTRTEGSSGNWKKEARDGEARDGEAQ